RPSSAMKRAGGGGASAAGVGAAAGAAGVAGSGAGGTTVPRGVKVPTLLEFLQNSDYLGALTFLEFKKRTDEPVPLTTQWLAYCNFHLGEYARALALYTELEADSAEALLYKAACLFHLERFPEAEVAANAAPDCAFKIRLLFHIAHKLSNETAVHAYHKRLSDSKADLMSLAAMQFLRGHHGEAIDIYKRVLLENRDDVAINYFIALCYFKLDYYDVSQEVLNVYLQSRPNSIFAVNLRACNQFRLVSGKAAESELRGLANQGISIDTNDLIRHNLVVFRNGDSAQRVLPQLIDAVPEARMNLATYHLRAGNVDEAFELMRDVSPVLPPEYILKAVCHAALGQRALERADRPAAGSGGGGGAMDRVTDRNSARDHLRTAQQLFNLVGVSPTERDTIPGRQCMASCFYLQRHFEDANVYLSSIKPYLINDDDFNWNYGMSLAAAGSYKEAEETLLLIQNPAYTNDSVYLCWLARCYIMNRKARHAWELYLKTNSAGESIDLLQIIANDCYKVGAFLYSAKAFDNLERLDRDGSDPTLWEGKRGACMGVFQQVVAGMEGKDSLREVLIMLRTASNPQVELITRTITRWAQANGGL
ncbi:hypothetical protein EON62_03050, partial [archaeon]